MTITLDLPASLEHRLRAEAARKGVSVDRLILQGLEQQIGESAPPETLSEEDLLKKISPDLGIAPQVWERYDYLIGRLRTEDLSETEHRELLSLIDVVEGANAERLKNLAELAKLRGVSLRQVISDLDIHPRGEKNE